MIKWIPFFFLIRLVLSTSNAIALNSSTEINNHISSSFQFEEAETCSICHDDGPLDGINYFTCNHTFHKTCIEQWKSIRASSDFTCPLCRSKSPTSDSSITESDIQSLFPPQNKIKSDEYIELLLSKTSIETKAIKSFIAILSKHSKTLYLSQLIQLLGPLNFQTIRSVHFNQMFQKNWKCSIGYINGFKHLEMHNLLYYDDYVHLIINAIYFHIPTTHIKPYFENSIRIPVLGYLNLLNFCSKRKTWNKFKYIITIIKEKNIDLSALQAKWILLDVYENSPTDVVLLMLTLDCFQSKALFDGVDLDKTHFMNRKVILNHVNSLSNN